MPVRSCSASQVYRQEGGSNDELLVASGHSIAVAVNNNNDFNFGQDRNFCLFIMVDVSGSLCCHAGLVLNISNSSIALVGSDGT